MSDENKEMNVPEDITNEENVPETEASSDGDWQWDAAVPETQTSDISFDDLIASAGENNETVEATEEVEEKAEDNSDEATEEAEPKESEDDGLCIVCGNKRYDSPSDLYCNECREKFLRTDYGIGHIILAFVMVIVAAVGYFVCASTISIAANIKTAESYISEKRYDDAVTVCEEITEDVDTLNSGVNAVFSSVNQNFSAVDWFNEGEKATLVILNSYADVITTNNNQHESFISYVEELFTDDDSNFDYSKLERKDYAKVKGVYDFCKAISEASSTYIEGLQDFVSYKEDNSITMDYDKAMKYIDGLNAKTAPEKCMADYCRFLVAFYSDKNMDTISEIFDSLFENAGEYDYIFNQTYMDVCYQKEDYEKLIPATEKAISRNLNDTDAYYYQIQAYVYGNDFDSADKSCEAMKTNNPDGMDYYSLKAMVLRRQNKLDEALKICTDGIAIGEDLEIYRQQAIIYMLQDKKDNALEAIKQSYNLEMQAAYAGDYLSLEVMNTAALITKLCGDDDTYSEISEVFEEQNASFEESVIDCIKGEITFEEIFMEGKGEV